LKLIRGNPGHQKLNKSGFEPPKPLKPPEPPSFLTGRALEEWRRVAPGLSLFGLLTDFDVGPLAAYCQAFARWMDAEELLKDLVERDPATHALLIRGSKGQARNNPLIQIAREAASDMVRFASEFGFSPAARSRIAAGIGAPQPSKFAGLLGGDDPT
jgi:P27 family predicted phage terminase small subunit